MLLALGTYGVLGKIVTVLLALGTYGVLGKIVTVLLALGTYGVLGKIVTVLLALGTCSEGYSAVCGRIGPSSDQTSLNQH